jgi:nucleotide-binding universal stress UspA family protein
MRVDHILFPVDFSAQCVAIAPSVQALAHHYDASLTALHVVENTRKFERRDPRAIRQGSQQRLDRFVSSAFPDTSVTPLVAKGDPAQIIAGFSKTAKVGLIMMPTHGHGPFRRFLLGSVTAKVLHDTGCPVWTAAHLTPVRHPKSTGWRQILCAVDTGEGSVQTMRTAAELAARFNSSLHLLHVLPAVDEQSRNRGEIAIGRYLFAVAGRQLAPLARSAGVKAAVALRGGDIAGTVARAAQELKADLVVIGRGHTRARLGRLRTHSYAIIRESLCPVLSI